MNLLNGFYKIDLVVKVMMMAYIKSLLRYVLGLNYF